MSLKQQAVAMEPSLTSVRTIISITSVSGDGQVWDESGVHMMLSASQAQQAEHIVLCKSCLYH